MAKIHPSEAVALRSRALLLSRQQRRTFVAEAAKHYRLSPARIRQILRCKPRKYKIALSDSQYSFFLALRTYGHSAWDSIFIAEDNGVVEKGLLTADTLNRRLRERGFGRRYKRAGTLAPGRTV